MATYFSLRDGLLSDVSTYGLSISAIEKTNNTTGYTLLTSDSWSTLLSSSSADIIDSIAVHLSSRIASPTGTLTIQISSQTLTATTLGTYPISSFTSYDGSNQLTPYSLNWQTLKLISPFTNSTRTFRLNFKTSNPNQLSLIGLSTVNGIDYDRMALLSSTNNFDLSASLTNTATASSLSPFSGVDGSIRLNGVTSTYVRTSFPVSLPKDFTIETWFYPIVLGASNRVLIESWTSSTGWELYYRGNGTSITFFVDPDNLIFQDPLSSRLSVNNWYHIAVTRSSNILRLFINGVQCVSTVFASSISATQPLNLGTQSFDNTNPLSGFLSNVRIINGTALYTSDFTVPTAPLNTFLNGKADTDFLYKAPYLTNYIYNLPVNDMHVCGILSGYSNQSIATTATNTELDNLYIHKNSTLRFPLTSSTTLTLAGASGLQITSEGTLQIGTSSNNVSSTITHQIILSGNRLSLSNGANLNAYGAYKLPYTRLATPTLSTARIFTAVDNVSSTWLINDSLIFTPNTAQSSSYDALLLSSFDGTSTFRTTVSATFNHSILNYIPNVANLTRNVKIGGASFTARGAIFAKDAAVLNLNNVEFVAISGGIYNETNNNGTFVLSGCTLSGNYTQNIIDSVNKNYRNAILSNNVTFRAKYGIQLDSLSSSNTTIINNLLLSSLSAGCFVATVSGNFTEDNNISIGPSPYGVHFRNNINNTVLSGFINYNNTYGSYVALNHNGVLDRITNTYNLSGGMLVDGTMPNLSSTTFSNITASNNRSLGFVVSGNPINHLSPIRLNINGLVANNNLSGGFDGFCITGNLTSLELNFNGGYGMRTSIGNGSTIIDGITALMNNVSSTSAAIGILSGINYFQTIIRNANVGKSVSNSTFGAGIILDSTKFSQFYVYNSTISGGSSDFQIRATRNVVEGSYLISNTNIGNLPVGTGITTANYQSDVLRNTGFAFTNMNNASGYNVTYLAAGTRQIDSTINITVSTAPSERLTPQSTTLKLRSGSKFVALSAGQSTTVSVYVRKSTLATNGVNYNGNSPRLMLKRNNYMGISQDIVLSQLDSVSENFLRLLGTTPTVTDSGVLEFYVDCDGTQGFINIDNWSAR